MTNDVIGKISHMIFFCVNILCFIDDGLCPLTNDTQATNEVMEEAVWSWSFGEDGGEMFSMFVSNK